MRKGVALLEIVLLSENKLKITLEEQDLHELSITREQLDRADSFTRQTLAELLKKAKAQTGFRIGKRKLFVEILHCEDNGCVICFTAMERAGGVKHGIEPVIFAFESTQDLCAGTCKLYSLYSHRIFKSSLYTYNGGWRLVVYPLDYSDRLSIYFLSEYARIVGENAVLAAFVEEHGEIVFRDEALDTLSKYFG